MLRINTGIEAHTHEFIRTGGENTKFGVPEDQAEAALRRIAELRSLRLIGLHSHVGSQIVDVDPLVANLEALLPYGNPVTSVALSTPVERRKYAVTGKLVTATKKRTRR